MSVRGGIVLYVKDLDRMRAFYSQVMHLPAVNGDAEHVVLGDEGFQFVLLQVNERMSREIDITSPPRRREESATKMVFFVKSIDAARDAAPRYGGEINAVEKPWKLDGHSVCDGVDPEGNMIQLRARQ